MNQMDGDVYSGLALPKFKDNQNNNRFYTTTNDRENKGRPIHRVKAFSYSFLERT